MQRLKEDLLLAERVMEQNYKLKSENTILLKKLQVGNTQTGIEPAIADEITMLAIPLDELDITVRMRSLFYAMGAKTLGDIADRKREDLLKYRNAGEKTAREVDYLLRSHGLWYRKSLMQIKMTDPVPEKLEKEATKEVTNRERIKAKLQRKIERMDKAHAWTYIEPKTKFQEMLNERKISHHKIAFLANVQLPQIIKLSGGLIQPHARTTSRICNALSVPIISTDIFKPKE